MKPFHFPSIKQFYKIPRWTTMFLIGVLILVIEAIEHISVGESLFGEHFIFEALLYGVLVPGIGAIMLLWLERTELHRDRLSRELDQVYSLSQTIHQAETWDELIQRIVAVPNQVIPAVDSARLYTLRDEQNQLEPAAAWGESGARFPEPDPVICMQTHCDSNCGVPTSLRNFHRCSAFVPTDGTADTSTYCLPLVVRDSLEGMLHMQVPSGVMVSDSQVNTLTRIGQELALVVENARLLNKVENQTVEAANERRRIARDLHDTLGQDISYLRLKLDQLSSQHTLGGIASIRDDLERMRDIATEAYETMRSKLANLHADTSLGLDAALKTQLHKAAERMQIPARYHSLGKPCPLRSQVLRQVIYICREALNNIEKHAGARSIEISVTWSEAELVVMITDDGIGFNPVKVRADDKLGLMIMEERARSIQGHLSINTATEFGTNVTLKLPLKHTVA